MLKNSNACIGTFSLSLATSKQNKNVYSCCSSLNATKKKSQQKIYDFISAKALEHKILNIHQQHNNNKKKLQITIQF